MCDANGGPRSQAVTARCATRVSSRRPRAGFWLVMALVGSSCGARGVNGQEDYDYGYGPPQPPMRAG